MDSPTLNEGEPDLCVFVFDADANLACANAKLTVTGGRVVGLDSWTELNTSVATNLVCEALARTRDRRRAFARASAAIGEGSR